MARSASRRWISPRRSERLPPTLAGAIDTAVRFLAQRPRSEYEVQQRLRRAGADDAMIDAVLAQLRRHQLVDDGAFAEYWVEQRQTFRPRGARLIRAELARRGIGRAGAEAATAPLAATAAEDAYRAAARRAAQLRGLPVDVFRARLSAYLARRGFGWDAITDVVSRLSVETFPDLDDPADQ